VSACPCGTFSAAQRYRLHATNVTTKKTTRTVVIIIAAIIDIFEEVNPISVAQNCLQPLLPHFVTRAADQIDQILAKTQDVCCIKNWFIVTWRGLVQINLKKRVQEYGFGGAVPLCT
jgi:hypothetical protein